jgi:hypothetical protein
MTPADGKSLEQSIGRIDELILTVEALPDPAARAVAVELVQAVMSLHAAALERLLETLDPAAVQAIAADEVLSRVLVLHGLHPDDCETRLARALDKLHTYYDSRGAGLEVLEAGRDLVRVRVTARRSGSASAARQAIEDAIYEAAPEVGGVIVEGGEEQAEGFVPLSSLLATQTV